MRQERFDVVGEEPSVRVQIAQITRERPALLFDFPMLRGLLDISVHLRTFAVFIV